MSVAVSDVFQADNCNGNMQRAVEANSIFQSRDIRRLQSKSVGGQSFSFLGSAVATSCLWLSNVAQGKPLRMTKPDHIVAALIQLKYLGASVEHAVDGLLCELGLDALEADPPARGAQAVEGALGDGDGMTLLVGEGSSDVCGPTSALAVLRRGGMMYLFDPAHGLYEYGPLQRRLLVAKLCDLGHEDTVFRRWQVDAAVSDTMRYA